MIYSIHTLTELVREDVVLVLPGLGFCLCPALLVSARLREGGSSGEHNMIMMSKNGLSKGEVHMFVETNSLDVPEGGLDRFSLIFFYR